MFCFKCGSAMADDANACPSCGTPASAAALQPPPPPASIPPQGPPVAPAPPYVPAQPMPAQPTEDKAVISLVLGILSLVSLSIIAGIPAIILGNQSRKNIRASAGRLGGEGMATAGIVMGWVSVGLAAVIAIIVVLVIIFAIAASHH